MAGAALHALLVTERMRLSYLAEVCVFIYDHHIVTSRVRVFITTIYFALL